MGIELSELHVYNRSLSALHDKMEGLIWTASCMRDMKISSIWFETDCSYLVDMSTNSMDWPAFASKIDAFRSLQDNFENLLHISQNKK